MNVNNVDLYFCDAEDFGFECTYPNCACDERDVLDEEETITLERDDEDDAYIIKKNVEGGRLDTSPTDDQGVSSV